MKKTILLLTVFLLTLIKVANSQIATIQTLDGTYGNMQVNVSLSNFTGANSVGAISMNIGFDTNVVSFVGITPGLIPSGIIANRVGSEIIVSYYINPAIAVNGIAFKLNFVYTGGSTNLTFNEGTEIVAGLGGVIQTTYYNGAINQPQSDATAVIYNQPGVWDGLNELPITFANFPSTLTNEEVGAINLNISYDAAKLDFIGIDGLSGAVANASSGVIHITWASTTPIDLNQTNLNLQFMYLGGASSINFVGINSIANANGIQIPVSLTNGEVTQGASNATVTIGTVVGQAVDTTKVDVTFADFPINQGAITMHIAYDNTSLHFVGTDGLGSSGIDTLNSNANSGIISLAWSNSNGVMISSFKLLFIYIGGSSNLEFTGLNEIANTTGITIPATFIIGAVTQAVTALNVSLDNVYLTPGSSTILVPISMTGAVSTLYASTMYINFDNTKLAFLGVENAPSGVVASQDPETKTIILTWSDPINPLVLVANKFLDLKFGFTGGVNNCSIPVYFTSYNSTASFLLDQSDHIVLANWVNGNINLKTLNLKVFLEGLYNGNSTMRAAQNSLFVPQWGIDVADKIIVELHSASNYADIIYASPPTELSTSGIAEVIIPNNFYDSYYITVKHRNSIETTTAEPVSFAECVISYDFSSSASQAFSENMKDIGDGVFVIYCGDFSSAATQYPEIPVQDGVVDDSDYFYVYYSYDAGDFGYFPQDINGDGNIDFDDIYMIIPNYDLGVCVNLP